MRRLTLALALSTAFVLTQPLGQALAHARLERSEPAPDSVVASPPSEVRIWMTQELRLRGNALMVVDATGTQVDNGDVSVDQSDPNRKQLVVTLQPLADGTYTVTYTSSSAEDGHDFTDSFVFNIALMDPGPADDQPVEAPTY